MNPRVEYYNVPLMRNTEIIERPAQQSTITKRYVEESIRFIKEKRNRPFFLYLANSMPHIPLFASERFKGKSPRGLYGDVIEEIDDGVGQIMQVLEQEGLSENTMVVFTSDNGPWLIFDEQGGSAGLLRDGKASSFEGGFRVPAIFRWTGKIKPGVVTDMGATMDIFPTFCRFAQAQVPSDRAMDGVDLAPALLGTGSGPRQTMFFYIGTKVCAVRKGAFKAHYYTKSPYGTAPEVKHDPPLLYNLDVDPSEKYDISAKHPEILSSMQKEIERHLASVVKVEDQVGKVIPGSSVIF